MIQAVNNQAFNLEAWAPSQVIGGETVSKRNFFF